MKTNRYNSNSQPQVLETKLKKVQWAKKDEIFELSTNKDTYAQPIARDIFTGKEFPLKYFLWLPSNYADIVREKDETSTDLARLKRSLAEGTPTTSILLADDGAYLPKEETEEYLENTKRKIDKYRQKILDQKIHSKTQNTE